MYVCWQQAILNDLCDETDTNLLYILSVPKHCCKCVANNRPMIFLNFNTYDMDAAIL